MVPDVSADVRLLYGFFHGNYAGGDYAGDIWAGLHDPGAEIKTAGLYCPVLSAEFSVCRDIFIGALKAGIRYKMEGVHEGNYEKYMGNLSAV